MCRGNRLDRRSQIGRIVQPLHHRDRHVAGGGDIGHRCSGQHAEQPRRDDRNFASPAWRLAAHSRCDIDEGLPSAGHQQERRKHDKGTQDRGGQADQIAPDTQLAQQ